MATYRLKNPHKDISWAAIEQSKEDGAVLKVKLKVLPDTLLYKYRSVSGAKRIYKNAYQHPKFNFKEPIWIKQPSVCYVATREWQPLVYQ